MTMHAILRLTPAAAVLLSASVAHPQTPAAPVSPAAAPASDDARQVASKAFKDGMRFFDMQMFDDALAQFRQSYRILPSPNSRLMIARALVKLEQFDEARNELQGTIDMAAAAAASNPKYAATADSARADLAELEKKVGRVPAAKKPTEVPAASTTERAPMEDAVTTAPVERAPVAAATSEPEAPPLADDPRWIDTGRGAFVVGAKFGALASLNGLDANVTGAVQVGYLGPWFNRAFGLIVDVAYAQPVTGATESDSRVGEGAYSWHLVQQQLTVQPSVYYRYAGFRRVGPGKFVPFVAAGPRIFFTRSRTDSDGATPVIPEQNEQSMQVGGAFHLGSEYLLGPGGVVVEALFGTAGIAQRITGEAALTAISAWAGYRFML